MPLDFLATYFDDGTLLTTLVRFPETKRPLPAELGIRGSGDLITDLENHRLQVGTHEREGRRPLRFDSLEDHMAADRYYVLHHIPLDSARRFGVSFVSWIVLFVMLAGSVWHFLVTGRMPLEKL